MILFSLEYFGKLFVLTFLSSHHILRGFIKFEISSLTIELNILDSSLRRREKIRSHDTKYNNLKFAFIKRQKIIMREVILRINKIMFQSFRTVSHLFLSKKDTR